MARPQKVQQERRPVYPIWEKVQEYYREWNMPLEGALLLERRQIIREVVAIYIDCGGCEGKRIQTYENQGQGFLLKKQVKNIWYSLYQEAQNWREGETKKREITRVKYIKYRKRDIIMRKVPEQEKKEILCPEYRVGRKREWWNWEVAVQPIEVKVQQSGIWIEDPIDIAREGGKQREVRKMFKILREV